MHGAPGHRSDDFAMVLNAGNLNMGSSSLAGQPLHTEEGSGVMPILDLFWRLCKML